MTELWFCCRVANDENNAQVHFFFSPKQCTNPEGKCIVMWKIKAQVHWFLSFARQQNHTRSITSFIHVIIETIMECLFWNKVKLPKWIMPMLHWYTPVNSVTRYCAIDAIARPCLIRQYLWMVWNWFAPVPQQLLLDTYAHTY